MKCHTGVDAGSGLVHTITVTAANEHDITQAAALIREDDEVVYGDAGYLGIHKRPEVACDEHLSSIDYRINRRPGKLPHVSDNAIDWERYIENRKSSVRCKVEHAFRIIKCQFGYKKTVYRGLLKNANRLYALFACANLYALAMAGRKLPQPDIGAVCPFSGNGAEMQRNTGYFPTESLEPSGNRLFSRSALNEGDLFRGSPKDFAQKRKSFFNPPFFQFLLRDHLDAKLFCLRQLGTGSLARKQIVRLFWTRCPKPCRRASRYRLWPRLGS